MPHDGKRNLGLQSAVRNYFKQRRGKRRASKPRSQAWLPNALDLEKCYAHSLSHYPMDSRHFITHSFLQNALFSTETLIEPGDDNRPSSPSSPQTSFLHHDQANRTVLCRPKVQHRRWRDPTGLDSSVARWCRGSCSPAAFTPSSG